MHRLTVIALVAAGLSVWPDARVEQPASASTRSTQPDLRARDLWLAPDSQELGARQSLAEAVSDLASGRAASAAQAFTLFTSDPVLGGYAWLYLGRAQLAAGRTADALTTSRRLASLVSGVPGYLEEAALWLAADAATAGQDAVGALRAIRALAARPTTVAAVPAIQLRLGREAIGAGDRDAAVRAFQAIYLENPLAPEADDAASELARLGASVKPSASTFAPLLARAEKLFAARRCGDARPAFESLRTVATGDSRELIQLRLLQCDFSAKRYTATLAALRTFPEKSPYAADAALLTLSVLRELGRTQDYLTRVKALVERQGNTPVAERALNELAAFYTSGSDDRQAAETFSELYRRFPLGPFAERAAWKAGWWAYKTGHYDETIRIFESAAVGLRHADLRPAWLYWAAKAKLQLGRTDEAIAAFQRAIQDYRNTYYGRAAIRENDRLQSARRPAPASPVVQAALPSALAISAGPLPDKAALIRQLLAAGMFDEAIGELRYQQMASGSTPMIEATLAYALNRQGRLRPAIQTMRRAYPEFMQAGGETLPQEILTVIFPVAHWELIQEHAQQKDLDRFLLAALIAQESTFQADIRSSANAWGLMQILPSTGRMYAQRLSIRPFSTSRLTDPETNVQIGTTLFAALLKRFGDEAPALAAYNAGESRVVKWLAARPGEDRDVFIDDIPFAETQNYVKRILGTTEDYRRLYR
ncbi:MAG TPA: transglycosylase SLT domain-containing protein [Vicinamibacterales bacterium]|nr:transglycosylase SLT domain-containing protein [Vicinamibacterales bacterium]